MAPLTTISFTRNDREYVIKLDLDDAAIMDGEFIIEVNAAVYHHRRHQYEESLTLKLDFEKMCGVILYKEEPWHKFDLNVLPCPNSTNGSESPEGMEMDNEEANDHIAEFIQKSIAENIKGLIDAMPVPDPILGCALKAGISSALGQSLVCNELVGSDGKRRQRFWKIVRCLRNHAGGIFTTALWRAARCMATLGAL